MDKHETIKEILISQLPFIKVGRLTAIAYEIREALFPVGGHHDHMCPCGGDWETKKQIAKQSYLEYRKHQKAERKRGGRGSMISYPDYLDRLDQEKNK